MSTIGYSFGQVFARYNTQTRAANQNKSADSATFQDTLSAIDKFMKYQDMTPAEKFRASYLAEKGLTEDDLAKMSPEDRVKIEAEIAARLREKMHAKADTTKGGILV